MAIGVEDTRTVRLERRKSKKGARGVHRILSIIILILIILTIMDPRPQNGHDMRCVYMYPYHHSNAKRRRKNVKASTSIKLLLIHQNTVLPSTSNIPPTRAQSTFSLTLLLPLQLMIYPISLPRKTRQKHDSHKIPEKENRPPTRNVLQYRFETKKSPQIRDLRSRPIANA